MNIRALTTALLLTLPLLVACGGGGLPSLEADLRASTVELAELYAEIQDVPSAEARVDRMKALSREMKAQGDALREYGEGDPEKGKAVQELLTRVSNGPEQQRLTREADRLKASPDVMAVIARAMESR